MPEQQKVAQDFAMSEISLILVLQIKTNKTLNDMAKVQIKSEKLTPFGGIFSIILSIAVAYLSFSVILSESLAVLVATLVGCSVGVMCDDRQ